MIGNEEDGKGITGSKCFKYKETGIDLNSHLQVPTPSQKGQNDRSIQAEQQEAADKPRVAENRAATNKGRLAEETREASERQLRASRMQQKKAI
ncbi:unnamed protein product [Ilex paraguariensis]|uniref:Uncharacterized protein n=1 Tax=Ilex paraguariensis TaxID=185542 RepID=A0ABC8T2H5_9AQUA